MSMKNLYLLILLFAILVSTKAQTLVPANGATDVSKTPTLTATFSGNVTLGSGQTLYVFKTSNPAENIALTTGATFPPSPMDPRLSINGSQLSIDLTGDLLDPGNEYAVYAASNVIFIDGISFEGFNDFGNPNWAFTTDATPTLDPANGATGITQSPTMSGIFSGNVTFNANQSIVIFQTDDFGNNITLSTGNPPFVPQDSRLSISGNQLTIDLSGDVLLAGKTFALYAASNVILVDGVSFDSFNDFNNPTWAFSTVAPEIPTLDPVDGATEVARTPTLTATFSDNIIFSDGQFITVYKTAAPLENPINIATGTAPFYGDRDSRLSVDGASFTVDLSEDVLDATTEYALYIPTNTLEVNGSPFNGFSDAGNPGWAFTTAADLPAPTISTYDPLQDATGISIQKVFALTFDREIQANQTATSAYVRLYKSGEVTPLLECLIDNGVIQPGKGVSLLNNVLTIDPTIDLEIDTDYYFTIDAGAVESLQGAPFAGIDNIATTWRFHTEIPPTITLFDPLQDAVEVAVNKTIQLTFDKNIQANATADFYYIRIRDAADDSEFLSIYSRNGAFEAGKGASVLNNILTIDPPSNFEPSKSYYLEIEYGAIKGTDGTTFTGIDNSPSNNYRFSTVTDPPGISSYDPLQDATEVPLNKVLTLTFDKNIQANQTGSNKYLYIYDSADPITPIFQCIFQGGTIQYPSQVSILNNVLTVDLLTDYELNTSYYVVIDEGAVESLTGDAFPGIDNSISNNWRFTTITPPNWANGYPFTENQTENAIDLVGQTHKDGTYYYVITTSAVAPTATQIEAGQDENNNPAILSGTDAMTANVDFRSTIGISILAININHYIYVVAKEAIYNQSSTVEQLVFIRNATNTWTGNASSVFNDPANWSAAYVNQGSIYVPSSASNFPYMNDVITVNNIEIEAEAELTIGTSGNVTVLGSLDLYSSANQNASLINDGTLTINSANVRVHQQISASNRTYYVSPAVSGSSQTSIGADVGMFYWDNPTGEYIASNPAAAMVSTTGYALRSNNNLVFTGALHNGIQTATVYRNEPGGLGWNLIGNPYPSAVEWTSPAITKTDILDAFWIYLNDQSQYGAYNASIGVAVNIPNSQIPSNHAFWVKVLEGPYTQGDVRFTNGSRIHNNTSYLKNAQANLNPVLKLAAINGVYKDEAVIAFNDNATNEKDAYDLEKKNAENTNIVELFTSVGSTELCINSLPTLSDNITVPLSFTANAPGTYDIERVELTNFSPETIILLEDIVANTTTNLNSTANYSFTTNVSGTITDRFLIHFQGISTGIEDHKIETGLAMYSVDRNIYIRTVKLENATFSIYNLNGQIIRQGELNQNSLHRESMDKSGMYVIQIQHSKGVESQKVLIK